MAGKERKVLLGEVGVDSGQLILIDPCYVDSNWVLKSEATVVGLDFWGGNAKALAEHVRSRYPECRIEERDGACFRVIKAPLSWDALQADLAQVCKDNGWTVAFWPVDTGTYRQACDATADTRTQGGQLNYRLGHPGLAVAFRSGLGDGMYNAYAYLREIPGWGERIVKVEIELYPSEQSF